MIVADTKIPFCFFQIQWSMRFEGEEVKVVALGVGWVAAVTSLNFLRIFTEGGLQVFLTAS
jgi:chromosome transmission fidelity protein 4